MKVHLTQYLCENRHCICAVAWEEGGADTRESVEQRMQRVTRGAPINPWCGICGSTALHFEDGITPFASLAGAMASLKACEAEQMRTMQYFAGQPKPN